jgi:Protein of unknown function (DUF1573)
MKAVKLTVPLVLALAMIFSSSHSFANGPFSGKVTELRYPLLWKSETIDLGSIPQNKPVKVSFDFSNSSNAPVIISNVGTSCGCTVAEYPKEPLQPGSSSSVVATYNAANEGVFSKKITVTLSSGEVKELFIKGTVVAKQ